MLIVFAMTFLFMFGWNIILNIILSVACPEIKDLISEHIFENYLINMFLWKIVIYALCRCVTRTTTYDVRPDTAGLI